LRFSGWSNSIQIQNTTEIEQRQIDSSHWLFYLIHTNARQRQVYLAAVTDHAWIKYTDTCVLSQLFTLSGVPQTWSWRVEFSSNPDQTPTSEFL